MFGKDSDNGTLPAQPNQPAVLEPPANDQTWQHPGTPLEGGGPGTTPGPEDPSGAPVVQNRDVISPAGGYPKSPNTRISSSGQVITVGADDDLGDDPAALDKPSIDDELIEIKQKALEELVPLIDKLDLPPQDKFRTIMMLIQTSDNEKLVQKAYEAAHSIEDEKARAQALLDIVNEINYFTQPH